MRTYNYKSQGWWVLRDILANGEAFTNSTKNFRGEPGKAVYSGRLSGYWQEKLSADYYRMTYVVWSYGTPIAWQLDGKNWVEVSETFSQTTFQHQSKLSVAIAEQ